MKVLWNKSVSPKNSHLALGLFLLALTLRLLYLWNLDFLDPISLRMGIDVGDGYDRIASRILETKYGKGYLPPKPVGYPLFLAGGYATIGRDFFRIRFVQCIMGSLTCVLMFYLTKQIMKNKPAAFFAGLLFAVYFPFIRFNVRLYNETLFMLLFLFGLLLFFITIESDSWKTAGACGVLTGLTVLVRAEIIYILPFAVLYLCVRRGKSLRQILSSMNLVGAFLLAILLILLPIMIRNAWAVGSFSLSHPQGFWILWAGNTELGYEEYVKGNPNFFDLVGGQEVFREKYEKGGLPNSWFIKETFLYIWENPGRYAWLKTVQLAKWFRFFPRVIINTIAILIHLIPAIGFVTLILSSLRRVPYACMILFIVGFYTLFYLAVSPEYRHRLPIIDPLFLLYAGYALYLLRDKMIHFAQHIATRSRED